MCPGKSTFFQVSAPNELSFGLLKVFCLLNYAPFFGLANKNPLNFIPDSRLLYHN